MLSPLPIDPLLTTITDSLRQNSCLILTATPGAGKTTRLPPLLLDVVPGKVAILQPRRMAAVSACDRVAAERNWRVGEEVGYQVRFESKATQQTRLLFMTDALLLRKMIDDPELNEFDLVVLDEFHERNLNQDLILGCLRELQELGRPIKLLIMSATLDVARLQRFIPEAPHIEVPGKVFPLEIRHSNQPLRLQTDQAFYDRVASATTAAAQETRGDVLVFLPGTGEIRRVQERLAGLTSREVVPLHGSLSLADQRQALAAPSRPRVILSTNVAEASVTVQGVDFVIDTGLAKVMETNPHSGFSSLELTRISLFNARQRAGRAARQKAGVCLRLWTPHEEHSQAQEMVPEVQRADLTQTLLLLSHFGVRDFSNFAWFDAPSAPALTIARFALVKMEALMPTHELTALGRRLISFPLPPRLGVILACAEKLGVRRMAARVAAMLNERDFASSEATTQTECDIQYRLGLLSDKARGTAPILESSAQLERLMVGRDSSSPEADPRRLLLLSQRDRLCRRRGNTARGLMVGGRGVTLDRFSQVRESEFFIALQGVDLPGKAETTIAMACGLSKAVVLDVLRDSVVTEESIEYVEDKARFFMRRVRSIDGLPLEEPSLTPVSPAAVGDRLAEVLVSKWDWLSTQNEGLGRWLERWRFLCKHAPEYSNKLSAAVIAETLSLAAFGKTAVQAVVDENLVNFLEMAMEAEAVRVLHKEIPAMFHAPSGAFHKIEYGDSAYVDVRLQEIFGLLVTPVVAFGKAPLTFRLLSPNFRPVQVTSDLQNFWRSGYFEVRKELRLRYPKHSWPEDPLSAKPEAKGRRRF